MNETITYRIGIDVAKGVFQVHAVTNAPGEPVAFKKRLKRAQVEGFLAKLPRSLIGMEACGSAHYWARVARRFGHEVRLMPPAYVKPYVKRNKSDPLDAEAICEAVGRPTMRFVPIKSEADQATLMLHRIRGSFVEKRTAAANQLRAALAEFGIVAAVGARGLSDLLALVETQADRFVLLPEALRLVLAELARQWRSCEAVVRRMDVEIAVGVKKSARARRLTLVPTHRAGGGERDRCHAAQPARIRERAPLLGLPRADPARGELRQDGAPRADHQEGRHLCAPHPGAGRHLVSGAGAARAGEGRLARGC